ncbi:MULTISPECIES: flagellar motor switch protein FliM [Caproicibacterium]|uniref:Flagellar motor switch protein FliM n=1 Tax=Caproicibacterium argilliputei TaxID=3030016 RepID=A0AA97H2L9_9FIRM|nr:flagellar motor switch protein FliM [Caproicibacterium argilliputei]WOC31263.1 flagellar motor switch protein FliM [Caproicibacterium argilliputei]
MPENLSQNQIDELMKRMHSGSVDTEVEKKPKLKEYDFSSPKKFTKEQLKSLNGLHDNFARVLSSYFTSMLRDVCEVEVLQIEEERYFEFNNALPDSSLTGILDFKPEDQNYEETSILLDMSTSLGYLFIERMLGGASHSGAVYVPDRDFTEIELTLLNSIFQQVTKYLQESWCSYVPVATTLTSLETNARLLQAFSPQDVVVIVALNVKMDNYTGTITICLPAESLEEVVDSFKNRYSRSVKQQDPEKEQEKREMIMNSIKRSDIEIKAVLDTFQMSLGDILQLQVQDVIALNKNINSDICVMVDGEPWYNAKLGVTKLKKSVKLIDVVAV